MWIDVARELDVSTQGGRVAVEGRIFDQYEILYGERVDVKGEHSFRYHKSPSPWDGRLRFRPDWGDDDQATALYSDPIEPVDVLASPSLRKRRTGGRKSLGTSRKRAGRRLTTRHVTGPDADILNRSDWFDRDPYDVDQSLFAEHEGRFAHVSTLPLDSYPTMDSLDLTREMIPTVQNDVVTAGTEWLTNSSSVLVEAMERTRQTLSDPFHMVLFMVFLEVCMLFENTLVWTKTVEWPILIPAIGMDYTVSFTLPNYSLMPTGAFIDPFFSYISYVIFLPSLFGMVINPSPLRGSISLISWSLMRLAVVYHFGWGSGGLLLAFSYVPRTFIVLTALMGLIYESWDQVLHGIGEKRVR
jgi:hypothetical protein